MDIEPDGRAFLQTQQRTRNSAIDGDRSAAPVARRAGRSGNGEVDIGAGYLVQPFAGVTCEDVRAASPGRHRPGKAEQTHSSCSASEKLASIDGDHTRSQERTGGKECLLTCRSRRYPLPT